MLHYMYSKPRSVFFTVGIKAIGRDVIQIHRRKIYKCARCLRNDAHHVIGYHTSIRISFVFLLLFFFIRIFHRYDFCKMSTNPLHVSISVFVLIIIGFFTLFCTSRLILTAMAITH